MAYGQNMNAPNSGIASLMAMRGREGDNTLVHVNPMELKALNMMAPGGLSQNPATGLPEAFKLKDILPALGAIAGAAFLGPAMIGFAGMGSATAAGVGTGLGAAAGTAAAGGNREEIIGSGLLSGLTAGLGAKASGLGTEGVKSVAAPGTSEAAKFGATIDGQPLTQSNIGLQKAIQSGTANKFPATVYPGTTAQAAQISQQVATPTFMENVGGLKGIATKAITASIPTMGPIEPEPAKGYKPIQSVKTAQQTPQVSREEIDEFIRKGGILPPFFSPNPNVITPGIYRSEGGQTSGTEMFAGRVISDEGDGMSDNVEFEVVGDPQIDTAMLSPDEHVISAAEVAAIGNGSTNVGHRRLEEFRKQLREARGFREEGPQEVDSDILDNLA